MRLLFLVLMLAASPVTAHELWIEPLDYQPAADSIIEAHIVNGQEFEGFRISYLPRKFSRFVVVARSKWQEVKGRVGTSPALKQAAAGDGLHVVIYQSKPDLLNYTKFDKFQAFATQKDFPDAVTRHDERELPRTGFREVYSRYSKSLIGVGQGEGDDQRMGMETEFVAIDNPYTSDLSDGMRVQLWYGDGVRVNAQVELFEKSESGKANITFHRTDVHGIAVIPVRPGHDYMIDSVVLREPEKSTVEETGAHWETLWANMTFHVPER